VQTTKLLHAKRQDGQPAFDFVGLRRLSTCLEDKQNIRFLLQNARSLEELHVSTQYHDILPPSARTLKVLDLTLPIYSVSASGSLTLAVLCEELEAIAGHNVLEVLSFNFCVYFYEEEDP